MRREPARTRRFDRAIPFLWLALSMLWAGAVIVTDQLAWPLALWIATTVGPLTVWRARNETKPSQRT